MGIRFGNMTFRELAEKHSFELTDEENSALEALRTDNANFAIGTEKCHVFDAPRGICCGTRAVFDKVYAILSVKSIKGQIALYVG